MARGVGGGGASPEQMWSLAIVDEAACLVIASLREAGGVRFHDRAPPFLPLPVVPEALFKTVYKGFIQIDRDQKNEHPMA